MRKTASSRCSLKSSLYHDYMFILFYFLQKKCEVSIIALLFIFNRPEKLVYGSKKSLAGNGMLYYLVYTHIEANKSLLYDVNMFLIA